MPSSKTTLYVLLVIASLVSVALALSIGSVSDADAAIIYQLRLPRVLAAFGVGGLLAMAGSLLQVLTRNPLAEPSVLGVSGGASVVLWQFLQSVVQGRFGWLVVHGWVLWLSWFCCGF